MTFVSKLKNKEPGNGEEWLRVCDKGSEVRVIAFSQQQASCISQT